MTIRAVSAATAVGSVDLETVARVATPVASRALDGKPRRPGWLLRKLRRESVDPRLSAVLVDANGHWLGFMWAGLPPRMPDTVCSAGLAVLPEHRGQGHAAHLLQATSALARTAGHINFRCLAEPALEGMYVRRGFRVVRRCVTLMSHGLLTSEDHTVGQQSPSDAQPTPPAYFEIGWRPDVWVNTPADEKRVLDLGRHGGLAFVSDESGGLLVHGLTVDVPHPSAIVAALDATPRRVPLGIPLFVFGVPEPLVRSQGLLDETRDVRWTAAQPFAIVERFTTRGSA